MNLHIYATSTECSQTFLAKAQWVSTPSGSTHKVGKQAHKMVYPSSPYLLFGYSKGSQPTSHRECKLPQNRPSLTDPKQPPEFDPQESSGLQLMGELRMKGIQATPILS